MRLVSIKKEDLKQYLIDREMLHNAARPSVLVMHLRYKGHRYDFAVPLRSNINPSTPKSEYFPLPPRSTTREKRRHGIHYSKMFPINRSCAQKYYIQDEFSKLIKQIIDNNEKHIISACQKYLEDYEKGIKPRYCTNIDLLLTVVNQNKK